MKYAFEHSKVKLNDFIKEIKNEEITIIDWGCGQGLATICFFDFLLDNDIAQNIIKKVILIEPSKITLDRAELHVNAYLKDKNKIKLVNKYIDDVIEDDIKTESSHVIHFFSNILDIPNIDLKELARKIGDNI